MLKKFYEKSEIWFSVSAIVVYVFVMGNLKANAGTESIYSLLGILVISGTLLGFILMNGLSEKYGLNKATDIRQYLYFIPLLLIASVNLWFGIQLHYDLTHQIIALATMILTGFAEELIFRGFLFRAIEKESLNRAIIISSVTFGAGHIINLLTGEATADTFFQMFYAIAIGFAFVMVFCRSGSIIPCIITHSIINATAELSVESSQVAMYIQVVFLIVVAGSYAVYLFRLRPKSH